MVLPTLETLERCALDALRTLGHAHLYSEALDRSTVAAAEEQVVTLRALGYLLEHRHGEAWQRLIERARAYLRSKLKDDTTADDLLYEQTLGFILALRHSPQDVQLAQPGLGNWMIGMALCLEQTLALAGVDDLPTPHFFPAQTLSTHERRLMTVARHLAALEFEAQLPLGHWVGPGELRETADTIRETIRLICETRGQSQQVVWAKTHELLAKKALSLAWRRDVIFVLSDWLQQALLVREDQDEALIAYGAIALCLDRLDANVVLLWPSRACNYPKRTGWNRTELTWIH